ncbi:MAG: radical SAM protein [Thermoguttaceae bacterium]|nr:radical SAM protein [Thermoguttaceae bacterium]
MDVTDLKRSQLEVVAQHRESLRKSPHLRWLFFEITNRCNLRCRHCGSNCTAFGQTLTVEDIQGVLGTIQGDKPTVCLTGGEPMMHPAFFEIAQCVRSMGFYWGMTTNATLIDDVVAENLKQVGMSTVSVSLDGMERSHDSLRQRKGSWHLALRGLKALQKAGFEPQVTTVLHRDNFNELDELYDMLIQMGITSWRPINVEPIGRACESSDMLLTPEQFGQLISYIRNKRFDSANKMEVTFGCSHYLGVENERMVRDHYFLCGAGILVASVRSNGDICACLDIENRPELVQGNIKTDNFMEVWLNRFQVFRKDRTADCSKCANCSERFICGGDSTHTWDFDRNEPLLCYEDYREAVGKRQ